MKGDTTKRETRQRTLASALLLGAMSAITSAPAFAQDLQRVSTNERVQFDIAGQPLSSALGEFARQAHVNALYFSDSLRGLSSPPLHGSYTPQDALDLLLVRSGFNGHISGGNLVLVQEQTPRPQPDSAVRSGADTDQRAEHSGNSEGRDETIVVTGTRIRGAHPAGSNLTTLNRGQIEQTARTTVQDVLSTLPQTYTGTQSDVSQLGAPANSGRNIAFGSAVDLRGLGSDATLTLVNGRRMAPAGWGNFTDISTIPLAAVDHIDVLADGASATYGSDAIAGVVNVILRDDFKGAESDVHYGAATRGDPTEFGFSQLLGTAWSSGNAMIGYEYRNRGSLAAADRPFSATSDLRPWGGTNFSSTNTNPGNITRIGATNVVLAIPHDQDGMHLSEADLLPGVVNYRPVHEGEQLIPAQESNSIFASLRQDFTPELTFRADMFATRREAETDRFQNNVTLVVPETNAYRQLDHLFLGQGPIRISYNMGDDLGPSHYTTRTEAYSAIVGLTYDFANHWALNADATLSHNSDFSHQSNVFQSATLLTAALASGDLNTAFNPFGDGSHTNPAVLQGLTYNDFIEGDSRNVTYSLRADGPLFAIWGGDVRLAAGVERRTEDFELDHHRIMSDGTRASDIVVPPGSRTTDAYFAEAFVPLVTSDNNIPFVHALDLSMSVRHEHASDYGDATTPKVGVTWEVDEQLALRASWGRSFKAPQFQQLLGGSLATIASIPGALDPFATNGSTGVLNLAGTNDTLRPERAENWTAGFDLRPNWLSGFSLHATYFDIDFTDRISDPGSILEALAGAPGFEGVFIRNPTPAQIAQYEGYATTVLGAVPPDGIEAIFDGRLTNLASLRTRGIDLSAVFELETAFGHLQFFASGTDLLEYTTRAHGSPQDVLDTLFHPVDWRARAGVNWENHGWDGSITANYTDSYTDAISVPSRKVASQTTWDLRLTRDWRTPDHPSGFQASLTVQNLFDADPPFVNNAQGYAFDAQTASPIGRFVGLELRRTW